MMRRSESFNCSQRVSSATEGRFETAANLRQGAGSGLVRRLVLAKYDPAKQRIRALLNDISDERLFSLGLTSEDIAALRGIPRLPELPNAPPKGNDVF